VKKKTVKNSTLLNLKGVLILLAFGIWVNLLMEAKEDIGSIEDAFSQLGSNTLLLIVGTYIVIVVVGLIFEGEETDRML